MSLPKSPLLDIMARVREPELPVLVVAHRGDSQNAPENTLGAFRLALEHQSDALEFDVQVCGSGEVVVIHDDKVDRTTDGKGEVHKMQLEELRELSAGSWFSTGYAEERIPTLDEVLDLCSGRAIPLIEIKAKKKRAPELGAKIARALERHDMADKAVVITREMPRLQELRKETPSTPVAYLTFTKRQSRNATKLEGLHGVDIYWKSLSLGLVDFMRAASFFITPWTVNRGRDMDKLMLLGIESIISDNPVTLRDRIEGFEFERAEELHERFLRGETDLDLEQEPDGASPDEVAREEGPIPELDQDEG